MLPSPARLCSSLFLLLLALSSLFSALADDVDVLYSRFFASLTPDPSDVPSVVAEAKTYQSRLNSSCYFTDVDYFDQSRDVWATSDHMSRLLTMTEALTAPSSPLLNDTTLSNHVHCGLQVWFTRGYTNPNWWWNVIGIPLDASSMMLLLSRDRLSSSEVASFSNLTFNANWWTDDWGGGANLVWEIQIQLYRGVTTRNLTAINQGFARMWQDVVVQPLSLEGVMTDYSYHFHGTQLLNGAYGAVWTADILQFALNAQGTSYALNASQAAVFAQFLTQGNAWMSLGAVWDFPAIGRAVDRPGAGGPDLGFSASALRQFAALAPAYAPALTAYADRVDGRVGAEPLIGHRHFYTSDYSVYRRPGFVVTLKLHSVRTVPTECDNYENLKGEHLGDGVLNVYSGAQERGETPPYEDIFPVWDWQQLNGVTCEADVPLLYCGPETDDVFRVRTTTFVGGVSDGRMGVAAMDTATHNLTVQRTWVFLPTGVLALASNLSDPTQADVRTTLHSRVLPARGVGAEVTVGWANGTMGVVADGRHQWPAGEVRWVHAGGVGYVADVALVLGAEVGEAIGNYATIGPTNRTVSKRLVTTWMEHGRGLKEARAIYAVLPNVTAEEMREAFDGFDVRCPVYAEGVHAVGWPALRRAWVVVWPGAKGGEATWECQAGGWAMRLVAPVGLWMVEEDGRGFTVTAAMPVVAGKAAQVRVGRAGVGEGCERQGNETVVTVVWPTGELLGKSVQVRCNTTSELPQQPMPVKPVVKRVRAQA